MRRTLLSILLATLTVTAAACSSEEPPTPAPATTTATSVDADQPAVTLPIDAMPTIPEGKAAQEPCPYLDSQFAADANGQRITGQGIDTRFDPPACVIWSYPDDPQLTIIVRHMNTPREAMDVVDWAAPVETTNPANDPVGWTGGRLGGDGHSVYAVAKDTTAVVVFSNQDQSVKPQLIAEQVIENLGL
ncbi:DUF2020 domain-containing protein [Corynebacterium choanae]|uniref:DUF2020 domain-containing protein n=1 Tax=Corynebacterium choanae TaxID=1862358 RepID=A0A3G6J3L1_9CORY|nr:DUF2020 domain-containing protein [Corynebacterium choanae]AZA12509.1 hypothetical protein CCHOA_00400 [Corynebacterium choanae]